MDSLDLDHRIVIDSLDFLGSGPGLTRILMDSLGFLGCGSGLIGFSGFFGFLRIWIQDFWTFGFS